MQRFLFHCAALLLGAEDAVAGVAQAGDDVAVVVQLFVQSGHIDVHIGVILLHPLHALGSADDAHELDMLGAGLLQEGDGGRGGAAGGQHGVQREGGPCGSVP